MNIPLSYGNNGKILRYFLKGLQNTSKLHRSEPSGGPEMGGRNAVTANF
jgi:hypothetical protein